MLQQIRDVSHQTDGLPSEETNILKYQKGGLCREYRSCDLCWFWIYSWKYFQLWKQTGEETRIIKNVTRAKNEYFFLLIYVESEIIFERASSCENNLKIPQMIEINKHTGTHDLLNSKKFLERLVLVNRIQVFTRMTEKNKLATYLFLFSKIYT